MELRLHHIIDHLYNIFLENDGSENCAQFLEEVNKMFGTKYLNYEHDCNVVSMNSLNIQNANDDCRSHDKNVSYEHVTFCGPAAAEEEEEVAEDQPSSSAASGSGKYLRVSDDLFVHLLGAPSTRTPVEGEVFDDEVLAAAGLEVVDEPIVGGDGSQEERLLHAMGASFRKLQALHRARLDKAKSRTAVVEKAEADL